MALLKKKIRGCIYYYYTETKWVNSKPELVKQVYPGPAEEIYRRLMSAQAPEPLEVEKLAFGGVVALWDQVQRLGLRKIVNEAVPQGSGRSPWEPTWWSGLSIGPWARLAKWYSPVDG